MKLQQRFLSFSDFTSHVSVSLCMEFKRIVLRDRNPMIPCHCSVYIVMGHVRELSLSCDTNFTKQPLYIALMDRNVPLGSCRKGANRPPLASSPNFLCAPFPRWPSEVAWNLNIWSSKPWNPKVKLHVLDHLELLGSFRISLDVISKEIHVCRLLIVFFLDCCSCQLSVS